MKKEDEGTISVVVPIYNQQKYLIETRCSGALIKPFSAIVLRSGTETKSEEPTLAAAKAALNK